MRLNTLLLVTSLFSSMAFANNDAADKASKELANPNTALASLTFKMQHTSGDSGDQFTGVFQPSMPFPLDNGDQILFRPAIAYTNNNLDTNSDSGFTDISFDLAYAPTLDNGNLLAVGMFAQLPTGSDGFSEDQYAVGPEVLFGKITSDWAAGLFPNHLWGVSNKGDQEDINRTSMQLFLLGLQGNAWSVGTTPVMSYDWNTDQAKIPLNLTVRKTVMLGNRPWQFGLEANYYIEKADKDPDFMLSINITPVVTNRLAGLF